MLLLSKTLFWLMQKVLIIPILPLQNFNLGFSFKLKPKIVSYPKQDLKIAYCLLFVSRIIQSPVRLDSERVVLITKPPLGFNEWSKSKKVTQEK